MGPTKVTNVQRVDGRVCPCVGCGQSLRLNAFSRNQLSKASPYVLLPHSPDSLSRANDRHFARKCRDCVDATLRAAAEQPGEVARTKRCVQCFRDLAKDAFSKRQYHSLDGKCMDCVDELESAASATHAASTLASSLHPSMGSLHDLTVLYRRSVELRLLLSRVSQGKSWRRGGASQVQHRVSDCGTPPTRPRLPSHWRRVQ